MKNVQDEISRPRCNQEISNLISNPIREFFLKHPRVKNFVDRLIYVSKAYIPNLRPLGPLLHVEKFVVVGGGGV